MNPQVVAALILAHINQTGWVDNNIATAIAGNSHPSAVVLPGHLHKLVKDEMYFQSKGTIVWTQRWQCWRTRRPGDGPGILQP